MKYRLKKTAILLFVLAAPASLFAAGAAAFPSSGRCRAAVLQSEIRSRIFDSEGAPKPKYTGQKGQARFADRHYEGKMQPAFGNVSAVLSKKEMALLGWQMFQGTTADFRALRGKLYDSDGSPKPKYIGQKGYARFADRHYERKMFLTFINVSAVSSKKEMALLGWQVFQGTTADFRALRGRIYDSDGSPKPEYIGMEGYARFADRHYEGKMQPAFINVSAVLSKKEMARLGWQQFQGTTADFRALRGKIYDFDGSPKPEYIGMEGYARFADRHYEGKMQPAFINVSAVLSKKEMARLGWKLFKGTVSQFHALKRDFIENYPNGWMGLEGQARVADRIFEGNKKTAIANASVLRGHFFGGGTKDQNRLFRELKWSWH